MNLTLSNLMVRPVSFVFLVEHEQHKKLDILKPFKNKKEAMKEDSQELEKTIYPTHLLKDCIKDLSLKRQHERKHPIVKSSYQII